MSKHFLYREECLWSQSSCLHNISNKSSFEYFYSCAHSKQSFFLVCTVKMEIWVGWLTIGHWVRPFKSPVEAGEKELWICLLHYLPDSLHLRWQECLQDVTQASRLWWAINSTTGERMDQTIYVCIFSCFN